MVALLQTLGHTGVVNQYYLHILSVVGMNIILVMSLNLINGYLGDFALGHAGFMGIGAYVAAVKEDAASQLLVSIVGIPLLLAGRDLLVALAKLKSTALDTSIFDDPVFMSLKDFGVEIASQPVGRRNPFAEFGDGSRAKPSAAVPKATVPTSKSSTPALGPSKTAPPKAPQVEGGFDIE